MVVGFMLFFFFASRRRHTSFALVWGVGRCVEGTGVGGWGFEALGLALVALARARVCARGRSWWGLGLVMGWAGLMRDERHVSWA